MRAIIETVFDIFYLVTVLTVGIRMIRGSKSGSPFKLFGSWQWCWVQAIPSIWCPVPSPCAPPAPEQRPFPRRETDKKSP